MVSSEVKSIVGQNCDLFDTLYPIAQMSMVSLGQSCSNCSYFVKSECVKGRLLELSEMLRIN